MCPLSSTATRALAWAAVSPAGQPRRPIAGCTKGSGGFSMARSDVDWRTYELLQRDLSRFQRVDDHSLALEEALNSCLEERLELVDVPRVCASRRRRARRQAVIRARYPSSFSPVFAADSVVSATEARDMLRRARLRLGRRRWTLVVAVALGCSYRQLARETGSKAGCLRVQVLRSRSLVARALGVSRVRSPT